MHRHTVSSAEVPAASRPIERRERELSFFAEITHALAATEDEREVLGLVLDRLRMVVSCDAAAIVGIASELDEWVVIAAQPEDAVVAGPSGRRYARADTLLDRALREARPLMLRPDGSASLDPLLHDLLRAGQPTGGMVVPVRGPRGLELGALVVLNPRERVLPVDIRFLLALADHAAIALYRTRAVETRSDDAIRLKLMSTVLQATSAGLEERVLLRRALEPLLTALPIDRIEVQLRDGGELRRRYAYPRGTEGDTGLHAARVQALHLRAIETAAPVIQAPDPAAGSERVDAAPYLACFPLQARDRTLGSLLVVRHAHGYHAHEIELLSTIGRNLGIAVELSRLFRRAAVEADHLERLAAERSSALHATQEQLARSQWLASLGEIAAGVAHDLNNALNPIVAFAELIKEHSDQPDKVSTYAERILLAAQSGAETVRRIQRFTRRRLGSMPFQPTAVDALVHDAIELVRPALAKAGNVIHIVESMAPRLYVNVNAGELRQALLNLITNAVQAMPDGGELRFVARGEGDQVLLAVQDTGTGMPPDIRDRALEPFFTTKGAHGTGLGLAEVFGIARRHGGSLELETWPGVGTTVLLKLPSATVTPEMALSPARPRSQAERSFRILLVDDNVLGLEATAASLRAAGHMVVTAPNAESALRLFRAGQFDVVLSDLGLPDLSGWELIERMRRKDGAVRIGLITGWTVAESDEELQRRGIELVLTKPIDPDQLLDLL